MAAKIKNEIIPQAETLRTNQVAEILGISQQQVRDGIKAGQIPGYQIGSLYLVPKAKLDEMLAPRATVEANVDLAKQIAREMVNEMFSKLSMMVGSK